MTDTVFVKDDLAANLLNTVRDTFHLSLMPKKDEQLTEAQAQFSRSALGATLARAEVVASRLNREGDICGVIGTTPGIIDGLRRFFADPSKDAGAKNDLATDLRRQQSSFNGSIDTQSATVQAIAPYLKSVTPPTERKPQRGFGC